MYSSVIDVFMMQIVRGQRYASQNSELETIDIGTSCFGRNHFHSLRFIPIPVDRVLPGPDVLLAKKNKKQNFNMQLSTAFILHFFSKLLFIRSRSQSCNIIGPHIPPLLLSQPFLLRFHKHSPYASTP